jgi:hypothetical protein
MRSLETRIANAAVQYAQSKWLQFVMSALRGPPHWPVQVGSKADIMHNRHVRFTSEGGTLIGDTGMSALCQ